MDSVFQRFESYDFAADERFVAGLKSVSQSEKSRDAEKILDLKLFFYNRFVEPIDGSGYRQQKSVSPPAGEQRTPSLSADCDVSKNATSETPEDSAEQLSFAEVMRLVQEGKDVPGVTKLDVQASNQSPTPSQMKRILKPWETEASSSQ